MCPCKTIPNPPSSSPKPSRLRSHQNDDELCSGHDFSKTMWSKPVSQRYHDFQNKEKTSIVDSNESVQVYWKVEIAATLGSRCIKTTDQADSTIINIFGRVYREKEFNSKTTAQSGQVWWNQNAVATPARATRTGWANIRDYLNIRTTT